MPFNQDPDKNFAKNFSAIPERLVQKVNGVTTEDGFFYIGKCIADEIEDAIPSIHSQSNILDFGCGLGRVISQLIRRAPNAKFIGFDIDPMMLRWASHLLQGAPVGFTKTTIDIKDQTFDLVIAISVFTHLDITTSFWLTEIHRLLSTKGFAFITYHDETLFSEMLKKGQIPGLTESYVLSDKYVVGGGSVEGGAEMGTFYTTDYWVTLVSRYFDVVIKRPRGLFGHQSYLVVKPKPTSFNRLEAFRDYAVSLEKDLFALKTKYEITY